MGNSSTKIKHKSNCNDSTARVKNNFCYFDKVPDEVLETIISYVPCKENCCLVNKRFYSEVINATRNRCYLTLNEKSVKDVESMLMCKRKLIGICLDFPYGDFTKQNSPEGFTTLFKVIERFAPQLRKIAINVELWNENDLLSTLASLEHFEELDMSGSRIHTSTKVQFDHLKRLIVDKCGVLESLTCPLLEELVISQQFQTLQIVNFISRHDRLKQLTIRWSVFGEIQCILSERCLKLTTLDVSNVYASGHASYLHLICATQTLHNKKIPELFNMETFFLPSLVQISPSSELHLPSFLTMNQLKEFKIRADDLEIVEQLLEFPNQHLDTLLLELYDSSNDEVQQKVLKTFSEHFTNSSSRGISLRSFEICAVFSLTS